MKLLTLIEKFWINLFSFMILTKKIVTNWKLMLRESSEIRQYLSQAEIILGEIDGQATVKK